jgi:hypothetical protein
MKDTLSDTLKDTATHVPYATPLPSDAGASPSCPAPPLFDRAPEAAHADGGGDVAGEPDDVTAVWQAWREFHPQARGIPNNAAKRVIRGALEEYAAPVLISIIRWAHLAPHPRASFLRGPEYERGDSVTGQHLGLESLLVASKREDRIGWAMEWQRAGSPDYRDASAAPARGGAAAPPDALAGWDFLVKLASEGRTVAPDLLALPETDPRGKAIHICRALGLWGPLINTDARFLRDERSAFITGWVKFEPTARTTTETAP